MLPGDRLRTSAGRAEILFPDGSALAIDEYTRPGPAGPRPAAADGRPHAAHGDRRRGPRRGACATRSTRLSSSVSTEGPGEYRVAVASFPSGTETELSVLHGYAVIATERELGARAIRRTEHRPRRLRSILPSQLQCGPLRRVRPVGRATTRRAHGLPRRLALRGVPPRRSADVRRHPRSIRGVAARAVVRLRVVPHGRARLAPVLPRLLVVGPALRVDVDRARSLGLAHASLRTLGAQGRAVVLDSRSAVGPGVGFVGRRAGIRGLVPARVQQSTRVRACRSRWATRGTDGWRCRAGGSARAARSCTAKRCITGRSVTTPFITQAHAPVAAPRAVRAAAAARGGNAAETYRLGAPAPTESRGRAPRSALPDGGRSQARGPVAAARNPQRQRRAALAATPVARAATTATSPRARPEPVAVERFLVAGSAPAKGRCHVRLRRSSVSERHRYLAARSARRRSADRRPGAVARTATCTARLSHRPLRTESRRRRHSHQPRSERRIRRRASPVRRNG